MIRPPSPAPALFTLILALFLAAPICIATAGEIIPFDEQHWDLSGGLVVEHLGRTSLAGSAVLKDIEFLWLQRRGEPLPQQGWSYCYSIQRSPQV